MKKISAFIALTLMVPSVALAVNYRGDFNRDSRLDMNDMSLLAKRINTRTADTATFDLNADGKVDDRDLEALANMVLSQSLIEDTGMNVGIGDWGEGGEFGGSVGMPSLDAWLPKSDPNISLLGTNRYNYSEGNPYCDISLRTEQPVSGLLIDFGVPAWQSFFMDEESIELIDTEGVVADHRLYGKPVRIIERDSPHIRYRILLFSPTLSPLNVTDAAVVRFRYRKDGIEWRWLPFDNCQAVMAGDGSVVDIQSCGSDINWGYVPVRDLTVNAPTYGGDWGGSWKFPLTWVPEDVSDKNYELTCSDPDKVEIFNGWDRIFIKTDYEGPLFFTVHTTDGSDITRFFSLNLNTGVQMEEADTAEVPSEVFTVLGTSLGLHDADAIRNLPAGLYIANGRKFIIK